MNLQEDYVSYEVAKLLNEKGFDEECEWYYPKDGGGREQLLLDELNYDYQMGQFIKSPSHALAMKWLREVHDIHISVNKSFLINDIENKPYHVSVCTKECHTSYNTWSEYHSTYEEAVEAAIKYSLENLI